MLAWQAPCPAQGLSPDIGRSSDFRATCQPSRRGHGRGRVATMASRRAVLFSVTAAGPSRNCTGVPFSPDEEHSVGNQHPADESTPRSNVGQLDGGVGCLDRPLSCPTFAASCRRPERVDNVRSTGQRPKDLPETLFGARGSPQGIPDALGGFPQTPRVFRGSTPRHSGRYHLGWQIPSLRSG